MKATKENNYLYNPFLKNRARDLRKNGTKSEAYLWKFVLSKRLLGYKFLRQRPVLNFIADFMCPELLLIIEADGITHYNDEAKIKDANRQKILEEAGFRVLRFDDFVIIENIGFVNEIVKNEIEDIERRMYGLI